MANSNGRWPERLLEDVAEELTVGHVGSMTNEYIDSGVPFLRSKNVDPFNIIWDDMRYIGRRFHDRLKKSALKPGDVVIVRTGKPGAAALIPDSIPEANCSDLVIVRCGPELDRRFLVYYLNSAAKHHVSSHLVGAVQQHFNVGAARKLRMQLPSLPEQKAIAHILGTLDEKIELNRRMNATLEGIARAVFQSWFVDFDPVRAKMDGRHPPGMDAATAALFPDGFEDSELGKVPRGWKVASTAELFEVRDGTHDSPKRNETGRPLITSKHIMGEVIDLQNAYLISEEDFEQINKRSKVDYLDTLISMIGTVGVPFLVSHKNPYFAIKNMGLFKTSTTADLAYYFYLYLRSSDMQQFLEARMAGTTQRFLSLGILRSIPVMVPPNPISVVPNTLDLYR